MLGALDRTAFRPDAAGSRGTPGPRTPGNGAAACACDVMRPPNDLPPANSGSPAQQRAASRDGGTHRGMGDARRIGPLAALLHVGKLVAQRRDAAFAEPRGSRP